MKFNTGEREGGIFSMNFSTNREFGLSTLGLNGTQLYSAGVLSTPGVAGIGYFRSELQPESDPRPYMWSLLGAGLFGSSKASQKIHQDIFALRQEVSHKSGVEFLRAQVASR